MQSIDCVVESAVERSSRVKQLEGIFDVPAREKSRLEWKGQIPIDEFDWNVGLIVGPSGCGKSTVGRSLFKDRIVGEMRWSDNAVIDDFYAEFGIQEIAEACSSVGFNTIPAWMRPFKVLSNGEQFRVSMARALIENKDLCVVDEFTSVVDRQVAQICSHAVQKIVRKKSQKFVAISCHSDIIEWLQPDWILEPADMTFRRRSVRRRPAVDVSISKVRYDAWRLFAPFHYLTAELNVSASQSCFGAWIGDRLAAFAGVIHRPHPKSKNIKGLSRLVTLPDFQGIGLAMLLSDAVGSAYKAVGMRFRTYPAHFSLIRSFDRSKSFSLIEKPGSIRSGNTTSSIRGEIGAFGGRPCAIFEYCGPAMDRDKAEAFLKSP
jgi:GNAT superfamily N-acetyltransferase